MAANLNDAALRKRSQIAKANRTMFIWIAIASALIGSAGVVGYFLGQQLVYNEKVLAAKQSTLKTLEDNNKAVDGLKSGIRVLDTNSALALVKASENDQAVQVILDALPSEANSLAFGASLQNKLLAGIPGLEIESMQVEPVAGVEVIEGEGVAPADPASGAVNAIKFNFVAKGNQEALKQVLTNLERSIRAVEITAMRIESQEGVQTMTVSAQVFYEPKKTIELREEVVPR